MTRRNSLRLSLVVALVRSLRRPPLDNFARYRSLRWLSVFGGVLLIGAAGSVFTVDWIQGGTLALHALALVSVVGGGL